MNANRLLFLCGLAVLACVCGCVDPFSSEVWIDVTAPPAEGASADDVYLVQWTVSCPDAYDPWIDLFVDTDTDPSSGQVQIAESLSVEETGFFWNCSSVPEDSYYVRAVVYLDGGEDSDYSDGTVTVDHPDDGRRAGSSTSGG